MNVTVKTIKTFYVEMTEDQAHNLLNITACAKLNPLFDTPVGRNELETLNALRQALLTAGVYLKDKENAAN
jgi:hypothetical protein